MNALRLVVMALLLTMAAPAGAHELRPAVLALKEVTAGRFALEWTPPIAASGAPVRLAPRYPPHCRVTGSSLDCGDRGLSGELGFDGIEDASVRVVVQIAFADGSARTEVLSASRPRLVLHAITADAGGGALAGLGLAYGALGVEHILTGIDHVLFVLALLLLVGFRRHLIATVTAFTVAHSITLALSVLGHATLPRGPVEATIALSILLVAAEVLRDGATLTRRLPWLIAFSFGLLHGFGFAGALSEIGLPAEQLPLALASFNVGVEVGQLLVIAAAWLVALAARRVPALGRGRTAAVYAMGALAAYWTIDRVAQLLA